MSPEIHHKKKMKLPVWNNITVRFEEGSENRISKEKRRPVVIDYVKNTQ